MGESLLRSAVSPWGSLNSTCGAVGDGEGLGVAVGAAVVEGTGVSVGASLGMDAGASTTPPTSAKAQVDGRGAQEKESQGEQVGHPR